MRYMAELSSTSHSYAELAGRTATNISDVVRLTLTPPRAAVAKILHAVWCME